MGAPVIAFCRIDDRPIRLREPIAEPDAVVVQDPTLLHHVDVFGGLRADGYVLINSTPRPRSELGLDELRDAPRARPAADGAGRARSPARGWAGRSRTRRCSAGSSR